MATKERVAIETVIDEMRSRASEGCNGRHEVTCCDPDEDIFVEEWCSRCLMGAAVKAWEERGPRHE